MTDKDTPVIVLGVIGADCHAVGNRILDEFFTEQKFRVINTGVMTSQDEFVQAARENNATAIMVSTLYGHGEIDCSGLRDKCDNAGLNDIILYIGGNLTVGSHSFEDIEKTYLDMGFNRAFNADADLDECVELLRKDISDRSKS